MIAHSALKEYFANILDVYLDDSYKMHNTLLEIIAAMQYANVNRRAGKCALLSDSCYQNKSAKPAVEYMKYWCRRAEEDYAWKRSDFWFRMRVMCMDVYTLVHIFSTQPNELCIFYGGESHARIINNALVKYKAKLEPTPGHIQSFIENQGLTMTKCMILKRRTFLILGENHYSTKSSFADNFIRFLKDSCDGSKSIRLLVEKHISNQKDPIQTNLMCNMDLAIHKFRCNPYIDNHHCSNLRIIPVDNRHYDMGFLRTELFDAWNVSSNIRESGIRLNRCALSALNELNIRLQSSVSKKYLG